MSTPPPSPAPPIPAPAWKPLVDRATAWRTAHPVAEAASFFGAGFLFDVATLSRIDDGATMLQLGAYMLLLGGLIVAGELWVTAGREPPARLKRAVPFIEDAIHFFFGSLLSSFALFYFKSAAGWASVLFAGGMFLLLVANELPQFRRRGPLVRFALFAFCVASFLAYVVPTLAGTLSSWLFLGAVLLAGGLVFGLYRLLLRLGLDAVRLDRVCLLPSIITLAALVLLYLFRVVPPVPLSVQYMGVYHAVERQGAEFHLRHARPGWKFWQHGDQDFHARAGDRVWVFVQVFAPNHFRDRVNIRWVYDHPKMGWSTSDVIPLSVTGGREAGFRGYAYKGNWRPGDWRVELETEDGRTIGYIPFTVTEDAGTAERVFRLEVR